MSAANSGAVAAGAEHHDRLVLGAELGVGLRLEVAAGDEHRAGDRALVVLVLLAHVEEARLPELGLGFLGCHLADLLLGLAQQVAVTRHLDLLVRTVKGYRRGQVFPKGSPSAQIASTITGRTSSNRFADTATAYGS